MSRWTKHFQIRIFSLGWDNVRFLRSTARVAKQHSVSDMCFNVRRSVQYVGVNPILIMHNVKGEWKGKSKGFGSQLAHFKSSHLHKRPLKHGTPSSHQTFKYLWAEADDTLRSLGNTETQHGSPEPFPWYELNQNGCTFWCRGSIHLSLFRGRKLAGCPFVAEWVLYAKEADGEMRQCHWTLTDSSFFTGEDKGRERRLT